MEKVYKISRNLVNGFDLNRRQPLLTNALPIIPEEPTFSSPLIVQGNLEAYELPAARVRCEREALAQTQATATNQGFS